MWYPHEKMKTMSSLKIECNLKSSWSYRGGNYLYICWENPGYKPKSRIKVKDSLSRCGNREHMAGDRGWEDFSSGEFWAMVTKSVLWLWKKDSFCGSNLNWVLMRMERNQTGKERLWVLVKNLEIKEVKVRGNAFSDLQNSLTKCWMR